MINEEYMKYLRGLSKTALEYLNQITDPDNEYSKHYNLQNINDKPDYFIPLIARSNLNYVEMAETLQEFLDVFGDKMHDNITKQMTDKAIKQILSNHYNTFVSGPKNKYFYAVESDYSKYKFFNYMNKKVGYFKDRQKAIEFVKARYRTGGGTHYIYKCEMGVVDEPLETMIYDKGELYRIIGNNDYKYNSYLYKLAEFDIPGYNLVDTITISINYSGESQRILYRDSVFYMYPDEFEDFTTNKFIYIGVLKDHYQEFNKTIRIYPEQIDLLGGYFANTITDTLKYIESENYNEWLKSIISRYIKYYIDEDKEYQEYMEDQWLKTYGSEYDFGEEE